MTSHEYAKKIRALADKLEAIEAFQLPEHSDSYYRDYGLENFRYYGEKTPFLAAVKMIGNGRKSTTGDRDFEFIAFDGMLRLIVNRDAVCRIVQPAQPAVYDCEPLLTAEEEAALGRTA